MDEYIIGSVADFISNKCAPKVKSKKPKLKLTITDGCESIIIPCNNTSSHNQQKKKKIKAASLKVSSESFLTSKQPSEIPVKVSENTTLQVITKAKTKKRKQSNIADNGEVPKKKKTKSDLYDKNHAPSENDDNENIQNYSKQIEKFSERNTKVEKVNKNTVFVGNIPMNYDKQKVCKVFSKFGEIQNARIRCVPIGDINMSKKVAAIKKKFNPKRNSLVAYVNFKSLDSAKAAVKANGMVIDGHHLRVDFADSNAERDNNKAVFVGGLPFDIEDDELWEFFENCGTINSVRIIRDSQTSMGKGFGYVNFDSTAAVELALQMDGEELKKRVINVKRCVNYRNKNKLNAFGGKKSKEMANQLLCKRGKKFKEEKKKKKKMKENKKCSSDFQGKVANLKQKKKKKLSKAALQQRKVVKILGKA